MRAVILLRATLQCAIQSAQPRGLGALTSRPDLPGTGKSISILIDAAHQLGKHQRDEFLVLAVTASCLHHWLIRYRGVVIMPGTSDWQLRDGEQIIACNKSLLGRRHFLIGITRIRNEALILQDALDYVGRHVDAIVAYDDASTDQTL
jgi:hypothetical protein